MSTVELDKLADPAFEAVREFLGWLDEHPNYQLAQWLRARDDGEPRVDPLLVPIQVSLDVVLYEYLGVDPAELEHERRQLLEAVKGDDW